MERNRFFFCAPRPCGDGKNVFVSPRRPKEKTSQKPVQLSRPIERKTVETRPLRLRYTDDRPVFGAVALTYNVIWNVYVTRLTAEDSCTECQCNNNIITIIIINMIVVVSYNIIHNLCVRALCCIINFIPIAFAYIISRIRKNFVLLLAFVSPKFDVCPNGIRRKSSRNLSRYKLCRVVLFVIIVIIIYLDVRKKKILYSGVVLSRMYYCYWQKKKKRKIIYKYIIMIIQRNN